MAEHHPDWNVMRWTDDHPLEALRLGHGLEGRGIADLVRLEVLTAHGGVYVDTDTVPLRPLHALVGTRRAWVARPAREANGLVLQNGFTGAPPGHRFQREVWRLAQTNLRRGVTNPHFVAGPRAMRAVARRHFGLVEELTYEDLPLNGRRIAEPELLTLFPDQPVVHAPFLQRT